MDKPAFEEVLRHKDHSLVVSRYGDREEPEEVAIECEDCFESLYTRSTPDDDSPETEEEDIGGASFEELRKHADCAGLKVELEDIGKGVQAEIRCVDCGTVLLTSAEG